MLRKRLGVLSALLLASTACSAAVAPAPPPPAPVPTPHVDPPPPPPQYLLARPNGSSTRLALPGGGTGIIGSTGRVVVSSSGAVIGTAPPSESISRVEPIPAWLGGGFLFQASDALLRADDFLGELRPIATDPNGFVSVGFGPTAALVVNGEGERYAIKVPTGERVRVEPRGASVVAAVSATRGVAIGENGLAYLTTDGGKTWSGLAPKLASAPRELVVDDADPAGRAIVIMQENGGALRVDASSIAPATNAPKPKSEARALSSRGIPFLDLALSSGASLADPRLAIVPDAGALFTVNLDTGEATAERGLLPPDQSCDAERFYDELLVFCRQSNRALVASRPLRGGKLVFEATFENVGNGAFVRGGGDTVLFTGPCHGEVTKPGKACVRSVRLDHSAPATWAELDVTAELTDGDPKKPQHVVTWIPSEQGAIVVLGAPDAGLLDARAHTRSHLVAEEGVKLEQVFRSNGSRLVERRFHVLADGAIEGWSLSNAGVRVSEGGKTIDAPTFVFPGARIVGPRALALSPQGTLWQSDDWGRTFVEVQGAPVAGSSQSPRDCSDVGCNLGEWLRVGWEPRPPTPPPPPSSPSRRLARGRSPSLLPTLTCTTSGALVKKALPAEDAVRLGFGAKLVPASNERQRTLHVPFSRAVPSPTISFDSPSLRAFLSGKQPELSPEGRPRSIDSTTDRQLEYIDAFDGKAAVKRATVKLAALLDVTTSQGGQAIEFTTEQEQGVAVPVLADAGGVVLSGMNGPALWARGNKVTPISFGADMIDLSLVSAIETKADELAVLVQAGDGTLHARRVQRGAATELFAIPAPPGAGTPRGGDALAQLSDGSFAVVRVPTASAPTSENPAYLLKAGKEPLALAPWSSVVSADDPACADGKGARAILATRRPWIALVAGQPEEDHLSLVRVRWSEERVCLEAAEVPGVLHDLPTGQVESYVAWKLGKDASAGHVVVAPGAEMREPKSCTFTRAVSP